MLNITQPMLNFNSNGKFVWDCVARVVVESGDDGMSGLAFGNSSIILHAHTYPSHGGEWGGCGLMLANYGYIGSVKRSDGWITYSDLVGTNEHDDAILSNKPKWELFPEIPSGMKMRANTVTIKILENKGGFGTSSGSYKNAMERHPFPAKDYISVVTYTRGKDFTNDYFQGLGFGGDWHSSTWTDQSKYGFMLAFYGYFNYNGYSLFFADIGCEVELYSV